MLQGSTAVPFEKLHRILWRLRAAVVHLVWHLKTKGLAGTLKLIVLKITNVKKHSSLASASNINVPGCNEALNLKAGELIEVKTEEEIAATLDANRRHRGLRWMVNMRKFCGKRYRVFKRLDTILLESNGEIRKMKNTVLLEGVYCDGVEFNGCERSCFHYWREAWLKRVNDR